MSKQDTKYFIYKFLDKEGNVLYVGQTTNLIRRLYTHFKITNCHLPSKCYDNTEKILFAIVNDKKLADIYETHYIHKYKSKYNKTLLNIPEAFTDLPELQWEEISIILFMDYDFERKIGNSDDNYIIVDRL